jgi:uncharacterized coiled-coil protein SlyX
MTEIFDDGFNPLEDLNACMMAIERQLEVTTGMIQAIHKLNKQVQVHTQSIRNLQNHITALEARLYAVEHTTANSSR